MVDHVRQYWTEGDGKGDVVVAWRAEIIECGIEQQVDG
jgi:hypothetical protein